jgi:hypothetical protein
MTRRLQHFRSVLIVAASPDFGRLARRYSRRPPRPGRLTRSWSKTWSPPAASLRITACSMAGATCRSGTIAIPTDF